MKNLCFLFCLLFIAIFSSYVSAQKTPETAENYFKLGIADLEADKYETADEYFSIALGVKPDHFRALLSRAKARHYLGNYSGARADADRAIKIEPSLGEAYFLRARLRGFELVDNIREKGKDIAPADYDGDGRLDLAVFRPSNGVWYIANSSSGISFHQFGNSGDVPLPRMLVR